MNQFGAGLSATFNEEHSDLSS